MHDHSCSCLLAIPGTLVTFPCVASSIGEISISSPFAAGHLRPIANKVANRPREPAKYLI